MSFTEKYYKKVDVVYSQVKKLIGSQVVNYQSACDLKITIKNSDLTNDKLNNSKSEEKAIKYFQDIESLYSELKSLRTNTPKTIDLKSRRALPVMDSKDSVKKYEDNETFLDKLRTYKITISDKDNNNIDNSFIGQ
jgi:hypothetical protein